MTTGSAGPAPALPMKVTRYQVVRRLTRAAAHSDAQLIAEAAALAEGWAVLADLMGGVVCSTPDSAGPEGVRAAAHPQLYPQLTIRKMAGAVLVVRPGTASPASRIDLIARTCVDLLRGRARVRWEQDIHHAEQRLHTAVLHLLLSGQSHLATDVLGTAATHATVFRLSGQLVHAAYQTHWRAAQPSVSSPKPPACWCAWRETSWWSSRSTASTRAATWHAPSSRASQPGINWPAASQTRCRWTWSPRRGPRQGPRGTAQRPAAWRPRPSWIARPAPRRARRPARPLVRRPSSTPLNREQHRTLEAYLRSGSAQAAAAVLDVSEGTVRARLRWIGTLLAAELGNPTVQAQLLLALRAPAPYQRSAHPHVLALTSRCPPICSTPTTPSAGPPPSSDLCTSPCESPFDVGSNTEAARHPLPPSWA